MSSYVVKKTPADSTWFRQSRFGMFIHFGLYALPARHEWVKSYDLISDEKYDQYFKYFNPDLFDAKEWARQAKAAGMKYVVLTTKHHEGFCLFDSQYTDYKSTNTPFGRDIVREYVDAFRAEGLHIGFYYSLIDWNHPDFPIDRMHPRRHDKNAPELDKGRDMRKYAEYMRNQVRELLTNYGKIDILFFDYSYTDNYEMCQPQIHPWMWHNGGKGKDEWEAEELIKMIRELQPDILINDRTQIEQDIWTPEQVQLTEWPKHKKTGELLTWEACQTFSGSWGYFRDEQTWKTPEMLINTLVNAVSFGGNTIMNVGPTARGYFDHRAEDALKVYADWMKYNSRSIYGCTMAEPEFTAPPGTKLTQSEDGKRLYIHLQTYPCGALRMQDMQGKVEYAQFLHDGSEILFIDKTTENELAANGLAPINEGEVKFVIPVVKPKVINPVIEVFLK